MTKIQNNILYLPEPRIIQFLFLIQDIDNIETHKVNNLYLIIWNDNVMSSFLLGKLSIYIYIYIPPPPPLSLFDGFFTSL